MKTIIDFEKIREQLPQGAQTEIAKRVGVSVNTVNRVLNGRSKDIQVITAIADYLEELKTKENSALARLSALIG